MDQVDWRVFRAPSGAEVRPEADFCHARKCYRVHRVVSLHSRRTRWRNPEHAAPITNFETGKLLTFFALHRESTDDYSGASIALKIGEMKTATRLQFSSLTKGIARAAAWAVVTMTIGLILVILFGSPLAASSPSSNDLPGSSQKKETGPWVYPPVLVGV